jgi:hypothetical protein
MCKFLDRRTQAKMQRLQNPKQITLDNLNNVRLEGLLDISGKKTISES